MTDKLRQKAEKLLQEQQANTDAAQMPVDDVQALVHELQVHQVELEMQNEELRRAQLDLADSRDRYLDLYELAPVGYLILDEHRTVRQANLTLCKLLGIERDLILGVKIDHFIAADHRDACFRHFRGVLASRVEQSFEIEFGGPDGSTFWGQVKCVPNKPNTPWPNGCRGTIANITALKQAEDALLEMNRELDQRVVERTADLRILISRLARAQEEERQRIAAGLHDEACQLVAAGQIKLAQARDCEDTHDRNHLLDEADRLLTEAGDEMRGLTFELSSTALFESGFIPAASELCTHMTKRHDIRFAFVCAQNDIAVPVDLRPTLYHCLRELLHNVVKHAGVDEATVRIEASVPANGSRPGNRCIRITVRDYGKGFDAKDLDRPLTREGGFGLRHLRERMSDIGGKLRIESVPGDGTKAVMEVDIGHDRAGGIS